VDKPVICSPYEEPHDHWIYDTQTGAASRAGFRRPASYSVVSTKNCTIAAPDAPAPSPRRPNLATAHFWPLHRLREHRSMPAF